MLDFILKTAEGASIISLACLVERLKVNIEEQLCNLPSLSSVNCVALPHAFTPEGRQLYYRAESHVCWSLCSDFDSVCQCLGCFSSAHHLYRHGNDLFLPPLKGSDLFCVTLSIFIYLIPIFFRSWVKSKSQLGINLRVLHPHLMKVWSPFSSSAFLINLLP